MQIKADRHGLLHIRYSKKETIRLLQEKEAKRRNNNDNTKIIYKRT
jgi:hypothetical protein